MPKASTTTKKYLDKKVIVGGVVAAVLVAVLAPVLTPLTNKIKARVDKWSPTTGGGVGTEGGEPTGDEGEY